MDRLIIHGQSPRPWQQMRCSAEVLPSMWVAQDS